MKKYLRILSVALAALFFAAGANLAVADPDSRWGGMGPGMMGGSGYGMGPGMMGGYGQGGMGPGMMGGYGMGHGMMGYGNYRDLDLNKDQRNKITQIRKTMRIKQWALMSDMMDAQDNLQELYDVDKQDAAAINKQYKILEDLRRQMVENMVEANNQINAILTKEQREKMRERNRGYGPMMWGY